MELVGLFLVIVALWCGYCGVESFNPLSLALAMLSAPSSATDVIATAKAQRDSTVAVATGGSAASGTSAGVYTPQNPLQPLGGTYGPFSGYAIGSTFAQHIARNSTAPGIDFETPSGTTLYSPFSGTVTNHPNLNSLAGNQVVVKLANGYTFAIDHVKAFLLPSGSKISAGQAIALSGGAPGDPGRGDATGAHAHVQLQTPGGTYIPFNSIPFG